jgi:RHS repeat-associated protein
LDQYTYDPYGNSTDSLGVSTNPFMYVGRELSDASGFYYMRGRYYSPGLGRFVSRNPIGLPAVRRVNYFCRRIASRMNVTRPASSCLTGNAYSNFTSAGIVVPSTF